MNAATRFRSRIPALLLAVAVLVATPARLLAHAHLTKSAPAAGARLRASPEAVSLWFSEAPEVPFTRVELIGPDSAHVTLGTVERFSGQPLAVKAAILSPLAPGRYTVVWHTAAADGHPSHGTFSFEVLPSPQASLVGPATAAPSAAAQHEQMMERRLEGEPHTMAAGEDEDAGAEAAAYVAVRWVSFVALLALIGATAFRWLVLPGAARVAHAHGRGQALRDLAPGLVRRIAGLGLLAAAALLIATIARLAVQSHAIHGATDAMNMGMVSEMIMRTTWGTAWLIQVGAATVALVALAIAHRGRATAAWVTAAAAALVLSFTPALAGHAAASEHLRTLAIVSDWLHVLGAGGWLGALLSLASVAIPVTLATEFSDRGGLVADLVNAFSPTALGFASLVVLTGLFAGWLHLGSIGALWSSTYGRALLIKVGVLMPVLGTGAYNWLRVRPALGDVAAARRVRRSATAVLVTGVLVIAVTAVLVALQPPV